MKQETSQEQWERLQREFQQGIQASYPNAERRGCPGAEVLEDLALRSVRFEDIENDQQWKHVVHCGPCYCEYLDMREACRVGETAKAHREVR